MQGYKVRALAALLPALLLLPVAVAQQSSAPTRAPRLTTEDVLNHRAAPADEFDKAAPEAPADVSEAWVRYSPEGVGLSVELPSPPRTFEMPNQDAFKNVFTAVKSLTCASQDLKVMVVRFKSKLPATREFFRDFMPGLLDGMNAATGRALKYDVQPIGADSYSIKATSNQDSQIIEQEGVVKGQGEDIWILMTVYTHATGTDRGLGKRVLASVKFP